MKKTLDFRELRYLGKAGNAVVAIIPYKSAAKKQDTSLYVCLKFELFRAIAKM